jgi:electron transport complex protein RnfA
MSDIFTLAVFSGISLNLFLQMGLGIRDMTGSHSERIMRNTLFQWGILFFSVLLFWFLFSYVFSPLALGYFEYFLLFPLIAAAGKGLAAFSRHFLVPGRGLTKRIPAGVLENLTPSEVFPPMTAYAGLTLAAIILTRRLAGSILEAVVLALGFSLGGAAAVFILWGIYQRSSLERIPLVFRGRPLLFIAMGLMSLIFSSVAAMLLQVLTGG